MKTKLLLPFSLSLVTATALLIEPNISAAAPAAKPNILIILADDMGFSDAGCYGGEIRTPNIDGLAKNGLRFTQFYNTARCWPTRSCIMSGYYAQEIRMDPRNGPLPQWTRLLPHYLKPAGYRSYHSGKWHVTGAPKPCADGGFDRSYLLVDTDRYFNPKNHSEDDQPLPAVKPGSGYYTTTAIADHAIEYLKQHAREHSDQPFFEYVAFTSPHFPLHALSEDVARYRDAYVKGWDVVRKERWERLRKEGIVNCDLAKRDPNFTPRYFNDKVLKELGAGEIKHPVAWDKLTDEQKKFQATKMAIHAAMVDRMDREIGRILDQLRAMNAFENTVIFFLSDNGADATVMVRGDRHDQTAEPGSAKTFLCVGPGWASANNAPFRRHKIWVNEGGISTPLIVHWPKGLKAHGGLRTDMGHVIDFVPTILELTGATPAEKWNGLTPPPLPGKSMVPAFAGNGKVTRDFLFWNHEGNRALRMGDWKLVSAREDQDRWELFDLSKDRCEAVDLASKYPDRVREMTAKWEQLQAEYEKQAGKP